MRASLPLRTARGRLTALASAGFIVLIGWVGWQALHGGLNSALRSQTELGLAALGLVCVASYSLPVPTGRRGHHRVLQLAAALFTLGLAALGIGDLLGDTRLLPLAGLVLGLAYLTAAGGLAAYLREQLARDRGAAYLADVGIVVISTLALVAPLVIGPLASHGGARGLLVGAAWTAELALVLASAWAVVAWVGPDPEPELVALLWVLVGGLVVGSVHVLLVLLGYAESSWWLALLYAPALLTLAYAPQFASGTRAGRESTVAGWSTWQAYLPYLPPALLLFVGLALVALGATGPQARASVACALLVSGLVMARQFVLLRDHRGLLGKRSAEALRDPLTGLLNRRAFDADLDLLCSRARGPGEPFLLLLLDLDGLKAINDGEGGHRAGDRALRCTAAALQGSVRSGDRSYRLGGDEFAALLSAGERRLGEAVLGRAQLALTATAPGVAFSAGVALAPADGAHAAVVFAAADHSLYRAKNQRLARVARRLVAPAPLAIER